MRRGEQNLILLLLKKLKTEERVTKKKKKKKKKKNLVTGFLSEGRSQSSSFNIKFHSFPHPVSPFSDFSFQEEN